MNIRYLIFILIISFVVGCNSTTNVNDKIVNTINSSIDDCPVLVYSEKFEDTIQIKADFYKCEPGWKFKLKVLNEMQVIFSADSLEEFEFKLSKWPKFKRINPNTFQILLEQNDRPFKNKIIVLTIRNNKLIEKRTIPCFDNIPKDIDNDGIVEYVGYIDAVEVFHPDTTNYNPVLCYEDTNEGFQLDTQTTISVNKEIWGDFYGFEMREDIKLANPIGLDDYLNAK